MSPCRCPAQPLCPPLLSSLSLKSPQFCTGPAAPLSKLNRFFFPPSNLISLHLSKSKMAILFPRGRGLVRFHRCSAHAQCGCPYRPPTPVTSQPSAAHTGHSLPPHTVSVPLSLSMDRATVRLDFYCHCMEDLLHAAALCSLASGQRCNKQKLQTHTL